MSEPEAVPLPLPGLSSVLDQRPREQTQPQFPSDEQLGPEPQKQSDTQPHLKTQSQPEPSPRSPVPVGLRAGAEPGSAPRLLAVTVLGDDRPGIVADVTAALAAVDGNLEDSTMTLLRGHFAMVVLVRTTAGAAAVESQLSPLAADGSLVVNARALAEDSAGVPAGAAYVLSVHGADRPGIVAALTRVVADRGGNIVDLGTRLGRGLYVLTAELALPEGVTPARLEADLDAAARRLGVEVHLSPVDDDLL